MSEITRNEFERLCQLTHGRHSPVHINTRAKRIINRLVVESEQCREWYHDWLDVHMGPALLEVLDRLHEIESETE